MRYHLSLCSAFFAAVLVSCSAKYTALQAPKTFQGKGAFVRAVDGIDFWANGGPERKYMVLGIISDDGESDSTFASVARKQGGNGVIRGGVDRFGNVDFLMVTKLLVIKYVE